jgi:NodT family efflux transporter outer membrane factor (OMF) lipoprotein
VSWTIDVWGQIRRQIEAQSAAAQASSADLANATLSAQGTLAQDYFAMRGQDSLIRLLTDTVAAYQRALDITNNQYNAGTVSRADVLAADAQLQSAKVQLVGAGATRAIYEHAIAVLAGHAPAEVSIAAALLPTQVPVVPTGLPSALLERRPDIAASERAMAEENANIGVAIAAYYPEISLTAAFGFAGDPLSKVFSAADRVWSLGASASETVFQGGARTAAVQAARAAYDESVASYRQTVLTAFQQVEDELSHSSAGGGSRRRLGGGEPAGDRRGAQRVSRRHRRLYDGHHRADRAAVGAGNRADHPAEPLRRGGDADRGAWRRLDDGGSGERRLTAASARRSTD